MSFAAARLLHAQPRLREVRQPAAAFSRRGAADVLPAPPRFSRRFPPLLRCSAAAKMKIAPRTRRAPRCHARYEFADVEACLTPPPTTLTPSFPRHAIVFTSRRHRRRLPLLFTTSRHTSAQRIYGYR